jgi:hypothetical protein
LFIKHQENCSKYQISQIMDTCQRMLVQAEVKRQCDLLLKEDELSQQIQNLSCQLSQKDRKISELEQLLSHENPRLHTDTKTCTTSIPLDLESMKKYECYLSRDYVYDMADGLARYAINYPFEDALICSDVSRKVLVYTSPDGKVHKDYTGRNITKYFFSCFKDKIIEHISDINEHHDEIYTLSGDVEILIAEKVRFSTFETEVKNLAMGGDTPMGRQFVTYLCYRCR